MPKTPSRDITERYLRDLWSAFRLGTKETSGYPALTNLLNEVGGDLKPRVRAINHPGQQKVGIPDFGLFTQQQLRNVDDDALTALLAGPAERGLLEVKGFNDDVVKIAGTEQVGRYLERSGLVLVTNYWDFLVVTRGQDGALVLGDRFQLTPSAKVFQGGLADPASLAQEQGDGLVDFLRRTMLRKATLADPADVADLLANYARDARRRIERKGGLAGLVALRRSLEQALGISFEGERGDAFFRSTLVQTLFYGLFSAWVLWSDRNEPSERFDWRTAVYELRVPVIQSLFAQIAQPQRLKSLNLTELLDWTGETLNRVQHDTFFAKFERDHAVRYFYEPFLEYFDPDLRRELGVWYTPPEVVRYMVARVDHALRTELGVADGLADERVHVLDPATGTGSFPVEVLNVIAATLERNGAGATRALQVKRAAMERIHAFELLPAPYVIAHMQVALLLDGLKAPLGDRPDGTPERASIFLTNSLTGWEQQPKSIPLFPELGEEADAAAEVKQREPIWVVIGNPPYNGYAGISADGTERDAELRLTEAYRSAKKTRQPQGQGLNDLYVRFFRIAERKIVDGTGQGIVCYISNASWLDGLSYTAMRERFLEQFDTITVDALNGDKYRTGKVAPDGTPDPSIFSTRTNREGIQVGTAIATLVRHAPGHHAPAQTVAHRDLWGTGKLGQLGDEADALPAANTYEIIAPDNDLGLPFVPSSVALGYGDWPSLPELFPVSYPGIQSGRDDLLVDIDRDRLVARMRDYFSPALSDFQVGRLYPSAMESQKRFNAPDVRSRLVTRGFLSENVVRYAHRPFDLRWLYWEPETQLLDRKREDYFPLVDGIVRWIAACQSNRKDYDPPISTNLAASRHLIERGANYFAPFIRSSLTGDHANVSAALQKYEARVGTTGGAIVDHILAISYAARYANDNRSVLRQDWPRIPLPNDPELLQHSADLGRQLAALLDPEQPVLGVTTRLRPELRGPGELATVDGSQINGTDDLALTVGWGSGGNGRPVMPGRGRTVARPYTAGERDRLARWGDPLGTGESAVFALLGESTRDVFLNDRVCWSNVPDRVWAYAIGGYQVIKKWLSYREQRVLGRDLTLDEALYVGEMVRRIAAILLFGPQLDASYHAIAADPYPWPRLPVGTGQQRFTW
jgi:hypothetical protein